MIFDVRLRMKTPHIFITLLISAHVSSITAQDALPSDSADLIVKLESFENQELAKAQKAIAEKKAAVVEVLESHMARETRGGNLDSALALKEKISELSAKDSTVEKAPSPPSSANPSINEEWFIGKTWGNDIVAFKFHPGGTGIKLLLVGPQKGHEFKMKWRIQESGAIEVDHNGAISYVWVNSSRRAKHTQTPKEDDRPTELKLQD